jgi:WD40 repeat protein
LTWVDIFRSARLNVINEGPRGQAVYRVLGRGPGNEYRLLYIFDGIKTGNQTLEALPGTSISEETAWEDISTVRVEILDGTGWAGFREVQVFSRQDPKPLPVSAEDKAPLFMARVNSEALAPITPDNAILIEPLAMLGRGTINHLAWSPDGKILAAASPLGVWLYDPASPETQPRLLEGHTRDVLSVAFSPDGESLYSASQDGTVKQWDPVSGGLKKTVTYRQDFSDEVAGQDHTPDIWAMAISPDAKLLATGADDGSLQLWSLSMGRREAVLEGHRSYINKLVFSPDSKLLASNDLNGGLFIWDAESGDQLAALPVQGQVQSLVFSPDSKILAYGGAGMAVRLWDTVKGEVVAELVEHTGVLSLSYSPDGLTLASSSLTGAIQFWDAVLGGSRFSRNTPAGL